MKKTSLLALIFIAATVLMMPAQETKPILAILDVTTIGTEASKGKIVYNYILDQINKSGNYIIVERGELDRALKEIEFSASDMVDDSTVVEIGKLTGAQAVLISSWTKEDEKFYLSMRVIDIQTAQVTKTSIKQADSFDMVEQIAAEAVQYLFALSRSVPLISGKTWTGHQLVLDVGVMGTTYSNAVTSPCVIKDGGKYKMWLGASDGTSRIHYTESTDGLNWNLPAMVIDAGVEGTYDTHAVSTPAVLKEGGLYKIWYSGWDGDNRSIIYAESNDGKVWFRHRLALKFGSQGTYDTLGARSPTVVKDGNLYKMWFSGRNEGNPMRIIFAESSDGMRWSNFKMVIDLGEPGTLDEAWVSNASVIKDNLLYKMWYQGSSAVATDGGFRRILYAESNDGISWSKGQMAVDVGNVAGKDESRVTFPSVINDLGVGKMWYSGWAHVDNGGDQVWRIFYAESK